MVRSATLVRGFGEEAGFRWRGGRCRKTRPRTGRARPPRRADGAAGSGTAAGPARVNRTGPAAFCRLRLRVGRARSQRRTLNGRVRTVPRVSIPTPAHTTVLSR